MLTLPFFHQLVGVKTVVITSLAAFETTSYLRAINLGEAGFALGIGAVTASALYLIIPLIRHGVFFWLGGRSKSKSIGMEHGSHCLSVWRSHGSNEVYGSVFG